MRPSCLNRQGIGKELITAVLAIATGALLVGAPMGFNLDITYELTVKGGG